MGESTEKDKVFACITSGNRLLVFTHAHHPEAGIQVPAGTVQPDEEIVAAAVREAAEETGLTELEVVGVLGERVFDMRPFGRNELHHRTFVHLRCHGETPERWEHWETHPDGGEHFLFALYWLDLDAPLPALCPGHDAFVDALRMASDS